MITSPWFRCITSARIRWVVLLVVLMALGTAYGGWRWNTAGTGITFDGPSGQLKQTQIVATPDEAIVAGKNTIWCASFAAAWKTMETDITHGPLVLEPKTELADRLNATPDPRPLVPAESLYTAAGLFDNGIVEKIQTEVVQRFPGKKPPEFSGIGPGSCLTYAYIEVSVPFKLPYSQNRQPLRFTDGAGKAVEVSSFGIERQGYPELRKQARVLFVGEVGPNAPNPPEYAVDLCVDAKDTQVVVACIAPRTTLAQAFEYVQQRSAAYIAGTNGDPKELEQRGAIGEYQQLFVPDMFWNIEHRFAALLGKEIANLPDKAAKQIAEARQDIKFKLDRNGAELKSEAYMFTKMAAAEVNLLFNRPFLVYLKKRDAPAPYFMMWVDNTELLRRW